MQNWLFLLLGKRSEKRSVRKQEQKGQREGGKAVERERQTTYFQEKGYRALKFCQLDLLSCL